MSHPLEAVAPWGPPLPTGAAVETALGWVLALRRSDVTPAPPLSDREEAIHAQYRPYPHRSREWLWGRHALKTLAAQVLGVTAAQVEVLRRESGAPEVHVHRALRADVFASLSHTSHFAVAAVSSARVGVDVADDEDGARLPNIAKRVMSEGEAEACGALASHQHSACVWALKEAVLKLREGGVFDPGARSVRVEALGLGQVADPGAQVALFRLEGGAAALAGERGDQPIRDRVQVLVRAALEAGAGQELQALLQAHPALAPCVHEYPWLQRLLDLEAPGGSVRVCRCTACGGRLRLAAQARGADGAPGRSLGESLEQQLAHIAEVLRAGGATDER